MPSQSPGAYPGITAAEAEERRIALPRGTCQASRWLAVAYELEQMEPWAANEPRPEVARWWGLLGAALTSAMDLVKQTRRAEPVSGDEFSRAAARLDGLWPLAKAEGERLDVGDWPNDPRAVLAWFTGPSMAAVAGRFTQAMAGALTDAGGGRSWGARPSDELTHDDPWHEGYRDRFAAEVEARLLPRAKWWPEMAEIHAPFGTAVELLHTEYETWRKTVRLASAAPALQSGAGAGALTDALTPAALLPHVLEAGERLASMNAEWWSRDHFKTDPDPDPDSGVVTIIDPEGEATWHRQREAAGLRDALRNQALRVCQASPGLPAPPAPTQDAERDITDGLARWCLEAKAGDGRSEATQPAQDAGKYIESAMAKTGQQSQREWLAKAMLVVQDHPEWSDRRVAQEVGKSPSTLSRNALYQQAAMRARQASSRPAVKGYKVRGKDGTAEVEAIDDSE